MQESRKFLRAREVAKIYGIGISTVWLYANQGRITPRKISPRVTVFSITELDALFQISEIELCNA